jgi:hypothetical protein
MPLANHALQANEHLGRCAPSLFAAERDGRYASEETPLINKLAFQIALALLTTVPVGAELVVSNEPVHHALDPRSAHNSLLAATIVDVVLQTDYFPPEEALTIDVDQVLLNRGWHGPRRNIIQTSHLLWPEDLLPKKPGQKVLLVLHANFPEQGDQYLSTVLPRAQDNLAVVTDENEALRIVESELLGQLTTNQSDRRLTALIQALLPVLTSPNVGKLLPFLSHPSAMVRRAALGATMNVAPNAKTAQLIGEDLQSFFSRGDARPCLSVSDRCPPTHGSLEPLEALFQSYPYLNPRARRWGSRWREEEAKAFDRIFELISSHSHLSPAVLKLFTMDDPTPSPEASSGRLTPHA